MTKHIYIAFVVGYLIGGINAYIWLKTHINPLIPQVEVSEMYTLWKLCPDGKTAADDINYDGTKIIKLPCDRADLKL